MLHRVTRARVLHRTRWQCTGTTAALFAALGIVLILAHHFTAMVNLLPSRSLVRTPMIRADMSPLVTLAFSNTFPPTVAPTVAPTLVVTELPGNLVTMPARAAVVHYRARIEDDSVVCLDVEAVFNISLAPAMGKDNVCATRLKTCVRDDVREGVIMSVHNDFLIASNFTQGTRINSTHLNVTASLCWPCDVQDAHNVSIAFAVDTIVPSSIAMYHRLYAPFNQWWVFHSFFRQPILVPAVTSCAASKSIPFNACATVNEITSHGVWLLGNANNTWMTPLFTEMSVNLGLAPVTLSEPVRPLVDPVTNALRKHDMRVIPHAVIWRPNRCALVATASLAAVRALLPAATIKRMRTVFLGDSTVQELARTITEYFGLVEGRSLEAAPTRYHRRDWEFSVPLLRNGAMLDGSFTWNGHVDTKIGNVGLSVYAQLTGCENLNPGLSLSEYTAKLRARLETPPGGAPPVIILNSGLHDFNNQNMTMDAYERQVECVVEALSHYGAVVFLATSWQNFVPRLADSFIQEWGVFVLDANARAQRAVQRAAARFNHANASSIAPQFISIDQPRWAFPLSAFNDNAHCILNHYEAPQARTYMPHCIVRARMLVDIIAAVMRDNARLGRGANAMRSRALAAGDEPGATSVATLFFSVKTSPPRT